MTLSLIYRFYKVKLNKDEWRLRWKLKPSKKSKRRRDRKKRVKERERQRQTDRQREIERGRDQKYGSWFTKTPQTEKKKVGER